MTSIQIKLKLIQHSKRQIDLIDFPKEKQTELFNREAERIGEFISNNQHYCNKDKIILCNNDTYLLMLTSITHYNIKNCKTKIMDGRGQKHLFIYDKKDGVFHNKNKNKILCPHFLSIPLMVGEGKISVEESNGLWNSYFKKYGNIHKSTNVLENELDIRRAETHTGNHHRNHFVSVPPSVYGN
jgi:hypothetical protein